MAVIVMTSRGLTSRSLGNGTGFKPPGRDGDTIFADRPGLDAKAQFGERNPELSVRHPLVRANPNDQHSIRTEEVYEPVEYRFEFLYRFPVQCEKRNVVLAARRAAPFCGRDFGIAAAMQLQEDAITIVARDDHAMRFRGARELDHRIHDAFVRRHRIEFGNVWHGGLAECRPVTQP